MYAIIMYAVIIKDFNLGQVGTWKCDCKNNRNEQWKNLERCSYLQRLTFDITNSISGKILNRIWDKVILLFFHELLAAHSPVIDWILHERN